MAQGSCTRVRGPCCHPVGGTSPLPAQGCRRGPCWAWCCLGVTGGGGWTAEGLFPHPQRACSEQPDPVGQAEGRERGRRGPAGATARGKRGGGGVGRGQDRRTACASWSGWPRPSPGTPLCSGALQRLSESPWHTQAPRGGAWQDWLSKGWAGQSVAPGWVSCREAGVLPDGRLAALPGDVPDGRALPRSQEVLPQRVRPSLRRATGRWGWRCCPLAKELCQPGRAAPPHPPNGHPSSVKTPHSAGTKTAPCGLNGSGWGGGCRAQGGPAPAAAPALSPNRGGCAEAPLCPLPCCSSCPSPLAEAVSRRPPPPECQSWEQLCPPPRFPAAQGSGGSGAVLGASDCAWPDASCWEGAVLDCNPRLLGGPPTPRRR